MYDPELPSDEIAAIDDAFVEVGRWHTTALVEGFVRPVLQDYKAHYVGAEAIIGYVKSLGPVNEA